MGLLGHILETVYGKPYADLIVAKVTGPLGLTDTVVNLSPEQKSRFSVPYDGGTAVQPWALGSMAGAGALRSTASDLARFAGLMMTPGKNPLRKAWEMARQPRHDSEGGQIGLNIMLIHRLGQVVYWHNGGTGGYRSYVEWSPTPSPHAIVVLMDNTAFDPAGPVMRLYAPAPSDFKTRAEVPIPAARLADYAGVYKINASARFTLKVGDGHLLMRLTGQLFNPIFYAGNDRFFARVVAAEFQFARGPDGRVDTLTLFQNGMEVKARRSPEPPMFILPVPAAKLQEYAGRYGSPDGLEFIARVHLGALFVRLKGQPPVPVFPDKPDHFVYDVVRASLTFERDPKGNVVALVLHQNGRDHRAVKAVVLTK